MNWIKAPLMPAVCWLLIDMDYSNNSIEHDRVREKRNKKNNKYVESDGHVKTISFTYGILFPLVSFMHIIVCERFVLFMWLLHQQHIILWYFNYDSSNCVWHFLIFVCGAYFFLCAFEFTIKNCQHLNTYFCCLSYQR